MVSVIFEKERGTLQLVLERLVRRVCPAFSRDNGDNNSSGASHAYVLLPEQSDLNLIIGRSSVCLDILAISVLL